MAILASLPGPNLFSNLPNTPPPSNIPTPPPPKPPIPIPKYPPLSKSRNSFKPPPNNTPAFKTHHRNSKYYKPIKPGQKIFPPDDEDRAIIVGNSGISYQLPGAPFEFMYSYSETPKAQPLAMREPAFLPFAPPTMRRPWTGKAPMKKRKSKIKLFEPLGRDKDDVLKASEKRYEMLRDYELGKFSMRPREEVLGEPLTKLEIKEMLKPCLSSNKQVNLGRDGLTHNMLELIHTHWRRQPVCKVRCLGVPTVDMDNICRCLEERSGGKIIHRVGGVAYLFRGRNYDHRRRPQFPVMLWKPATPVYPKLIQNAPEGLTEEEADEFRTKGKRLLPICKLAKNGVYINLVRDVRTAFEGSELVKIDCRGLQPSDYKKVGAKLKELVPCVLLSFDDEQVLMWRGREWKSMYQEIPKIFLPSADCSAVTNTSDAETVISSPKMTMLWQRALELGKASVLDEINLSPDELMSKVEEFESTSQAIEHSYPALIFSNRKGSSTSTSQLEDDDSEDKDYSEDDDSFDGYEDRFRINDSFDAVVNSVPQGSLPIDLLAKHHLSGSLFNEPWWPVMTADTTAPSYWLNWRFLLCAIWISVAMISAALIIWRYEGHKNSRNRVNGDQREAAGQGRLYKDESWATCLKSIHPVWLLVYRVVAFCSLLALILADTIIHSVGIFYFYTQWTFTLVTIYFGIGFLLSIHGCLVNRCKADSERDHCVGSTDAERGSFVAPAVGENGNGNDRYDLNRDAASVWEYAFQIIFQTSAGAVVLTDSVFWLVIYPFLTDKDYKLSFVSTRLSTVYYIARSSYVLSSLTNSFNAM
ncbi:hypothetical protein ACS0TY_009075 [Phlomoides rotata]